MRTWLFCPGNDQAKLGKALVAGSDVVIIDWEDSVVSGQKHEARVVTARMLTEVRSRSRLMIRISSTDDQHFGEDVRRLASLPQVSGVMLPKVARPADLLEVTHLDLPIVALIESAKGVEHAFDIASASERTERLAFGSLDFCAEAGCTWSPANPLLEHVRARLVVAGHAAGLQGSIDGLYPRLDDREGLVRDAKRAKDLGFAGKLVIHPKQLEGVRDAFRPNEEEVERARRIVAASLSAERDQSRAATQVDGEFVDPPVVRWAHQVLDEVASAHEADT